MSTAARSVRDIAVVLWAVGGVLAVIVQALSRLVPMALEPLRELEALGTIERSSYALWVIACGYLEGYRGFQRSFSPRVVGRAFELAHGGSFGQILFAPAYAMALFHASPRQLARAWGLVAGIAALVVLVRLLPQPWRGIVDGGVVVGLGWGLASLVIGCARAFRSGPPAVDLGLPIPPVDTTGGNRYESRPSKEGL